MPSQGGGASQAAPDTGAGVTNQMPEAQPGQAEQGQAQGEDQGGQSQQGQKKAGQKSSDSMKKKQTGQTEGGTDKKKSQESSGTTGATDKASKISIPEGKRSQVAKSFSSHKVKHTDIDINVSLGVAVPASVVLYPVPVDIVEIVPAFRHYKYFVLASGEIVIVDPATLVVVYVVAA